MVYRTRYKRRSTRRYPTKRKSPARRRSFVKRRSITRTKRMSARKILNVSSVKKRDTMLCWTNSTAAAQQGGSTYSNAPAVVTGGLADTNAQCFLWNATARDNTSSYNGPAGNKFNTATRTSTNCYMVGLSESVEIQCNTGMPWQWRRICFTMKGPSLVPTNAASGVVFTAAAETSNGWQRIMNQVVGNPGTNPQYTFMQTLFKGQCQGDWIDPITAPVDNSRITIKYDKVRSLASGNEDGFIRTYKLWHPMRAMLYYDDDENGGTEVASIQSSTGKAGMGDYYIVDLFRARQGSATADQLTIRPQSTLYWHER
ncbi:capsid protein [Bark beetle-associated genomovirus 3]|uniref:Capsid protein n=1 Tax=Bark beetle-associated genomovirus 3 TaxID=2230898 RepID=A0A344A3Q0_9VIRU|nr:capsid protein [Bark beetle-associated genomovirus 3]AWU66515.1 capsid protein [Bark beetle-associated genomovirus 3]